MAKKGKTKSNKGKVVIIILALLCLTGVSVIFFSRNRIAKISENIEARNGYEIRVALLYNGNSSSNTYKMMYDYLLQPVAVNLTAELVDYNDLYDLRAYDWIYLDESVLECDTSKLISDVMEYTLDGGNVFLTNSFCEVFPKDYIGAKEVREIGKFPIQLKKSFVEMDLLDIQNLVCDYFELYNGFVDIDELKQMDYGYGIIPDHAKSIIKADGITLYSMNEYGKGRVLFTNNLLPNMFSKATFDMKDIGENQTSYSNTTASCNQLLLSDFAEYVAKKIYGFSISRVFGNYGSPSIAWELHYEDMEGIENDALIDFSEICESKNQIPSYTLVRDTYVWFEQAETMSYLLNFDTDIYEGMYSSGTHIACDGEWMQLNALQDCTSFFKDDPNENYRLYPCAIDYNQDGNVDFFCGSADGKVYYFEGNGMTGIDGRLCVAKAIPVENVNVRAFSAPCVVDFNGDGINDLIVGADDGKIYYFEGKGFFQFDNGIELVDCGIEGQVLPTIADINSDGNTDIVVGTNIGQLFVYYDCDTESKKAYDIIIPEIEYNFWVAPYVVDYDNDGLRDILVGTYEGYIAVGTYDEQKGFLFEQFLSDQYLNYKGNNYLKFGHFASPIMWDLNQDGKLDLICGHEEYGLAYPIDCAYFPYKDKLQEQISYAKEHNYYVGMHYLTGNYMSTEQELLEIEYHKNALSAYGIEGIYGANQHTWKMSEMTEDKQSFSNLYKEGILWESGYAPPNMTIEMPYNQKENAIAYPFYLMEDGERTLFIQNCSTLYYTDWHWTDFSGKYKMPMLVYYHCDKINRDESDLQNAINAMDVVADFSAEYGYNCVREDQLMRSSAAAYNLAVDVTANDGRIYIFPRANSSNGMLYDENVQNACGVEVQFSNNWIGFVGTNAHIWKKKGNSLYIGLDESIQLYDQLVKKEKHIMQVNIPAEIETDKIGGVLKFQDSGMMQIIVSGKASTKDQTWNITEVNGNTMFTKFGDADMLEFYYK